MWFHLLLSLCLSALLLSNAHERQHHEHKGKKHLDSSVKWEYGAENGAAKHGTLRMGDSKEDETLRQQWIDHHNNVQDLSNLLFPNKSIVPIERRMAHHQLQQQQKQQKQTNRKLTIPCVICRDMEYCDALNGYQIQEVYLPYNLNDLGTCRVLDALGENVATEVFGNGRTFRDTKQCKDIVMQYLCLFYGSDNEMYENACINQEDVSDSNPINHKVAPRPPCRSFCVQVAEVCANDPKFMQLCYNIKCPPMEDSCTPDPKVEGQVLAANIGCDMPYDVNPYFKKNGASSRFILDWALVGVAVGAGLWVGA